MSFVSSHRAVLKQHPHKVKEINIVMPQSNSNWKKPNSEWRHTNLYMNLDTILPWSPQYIALVSDEAEQLALCLNYNTYA